VTVPRRLLPAILAVAAVVGVVVGLRLYALFTGG
jgi:hypothetical protein